MLQHAQQQQQPSSSSSLLAQRRIIRRKCTSRHQRRFGAFSSDGGEETKTKVVVFSTHDYEKKILENQLNSNFEVTFLAPRLTIETVDLAKGFDVACCFVNDDLSSDVVVRLRETCGVKMIALRCAGFDKVDVEACKKLKVRVYRVPMYDPLSIAEHAMALILALNRKIMISHARVKSGNFTLDGLVGFSMRGKTIGIVGTGKIGRGLANICAKGFGMSVLGYDLKQKREFVGQYCDDVETVLKNSDIVSLHLPLNEHTKHFIAEKEIAAMKKGAMLINTSRGGLLNIKDPQTIKTTNINLKDKNIFIYTDGVTEGYIEGEKEFTVKGVEDEVLKNSSSDIKEIIDRITNKLNNREKLRDDITMMGLQ